MLLVLRRRGHVPLVLLDVICHVYLLRHVVIIVLSDGIQNVAPFGDDLAQTKVECPKLNSSFGQEAVLLQVAAPGIGGGGDNTAGPKAVPKLLDTDSSFVTDAVGRVSPSSCA